jgi:hypothetical protein
MVDKKKLKQIRKIQSERFIRGNEGMKARKKNKKDK